jgi:hypothetical protein
MDRGGSAFPSSALLAERTALSQRAVLEHLERASGEGWLRRQLKGTGQAWRCWHYVARLPDVLTDGQQLSAEGADAGSAASMQEGADPHAEGADPHDKKVLTVRQRNSSVNTKKNSSSVDVRKNGQRQLHHERLNGKPRNSAAWASTEEAG